MRSDEPELKPCAHCGGKAHIFPLDKTEGLRVVYDFAHPYYRVVCQGGCGCIMGDYETREQAIEAWNTRAAALTAEQVRDAVYQADALGLETIDLFDWQAIADELNAEQAVDSRKGRGECRNLSPYNTFECSSCGTYVDGGDELGVCTDDWPFKYCPNCGAEVGA